MSKKSIFERNIKKFRHNPVSNRYVYDGYTIVFDKVEATKIDQSAQELVIYCSGSSLVYRIYEYREFLKSYYAYLDYKQSKL